MRQGAIWIVVAALLGVLCSGAVAQEDPRFQSSIYQTGPLKPIDSGPSLKAGDMAPDFNLPSIDGGRVTLGQFRGKKNVVLSFIPAAWTPVCSGQWPGYNIARDLFDKADAVVVGISVDNVPTLHAWVRQMGGLWFPVASDFHPHGQTAKAYGVLRTTGEAERALVLVDQQGVIRYVDVHDINSRPDLGALARAMNALVP